MYHPNNAAETMYGDSWRLRVLAFIGWALGIQFKVGGMPFGAAFNRSRYEAFYGERSGSCSSQ